jgi:hypothetical protein
MSEDEERHRLEQAWKYASGDVRRAFMLACYREQGAAGESTIHIMGFFAQPPEKVYFSHIPPK